MWIAIFICWWIGAYLSFALSWMRFTEGKFANKSKWTQAGLILIGTCLSWLNVIVELTIINKELKEEEDLWNK